MFHVSLNRKLWAKTVLFFKITCTIKKKLEASATLILFCNKECNNWSNKLVVSSHFSLNLNFWKVILTYFLFLRLFTMLFDEAQVTEESLARRKGLVLTGLMCSWVFWGVYLFCFVLFCKLNHYIKYNGIVAIFQLWVNCVNK